MDRTRILFVDEDPHVLAGLRRMLRKQRSAWDIAFVATGADALRRLAESPPFDVIVTDAQLADMSGAELLGQVVAHHPSVARIVLSGFTDETNSNRVLKVAHQFLSKPVDDVTLTEAVTRACAATRNMSGSRVRAITASLGALPSPPDLYWRLADAAASKATNAAAIATVIARDPATSAKLLQLVNSSFFGLSRRVSGIEQAVSLLGIARVKSLVLSAQIVEQFVIDHEVPGFSLERLLQRSVVVAQLAQLVSELEGQDGERQEQSFTAGLLHDVGLLVLAARQCDGLTAVMEGLQSGEVSLCNAERCVFGATHAEVGAALLELWTLPPRIVEGVALHHDPQETPFNGVSAVTAVHVAAALLPVLEVSGELAVQEACFHPALNTAYLARIGRYHHIDDWKRHLAGRLAVQQPAAGPCAAARASAAPPALVEEKGSAL